ncbi:MAG: GlxA family transcriptional regulator [Proteobacteria bacterium]|nr:GlxA family transcriptional regulator [Pseudomonadota bacterium]
MSPNPRFTPPPRPIELLLFPAAQLLDITGPLQVFASANDWAAATRRPTPYEIRLVATRSPVRTTAGVRLLAEPLPRGVPPPDTLLVAGGRGVHVACDDRHLVRWLRTRARRARRIVSICSGAFLLGRAGLLDDRRAVTHWSECGELARRCPRTRVELDPLFVRDGPVSSSAGVTAGIDLALALVEEDLGHAAAIAVARDLVVYLKRPGGQSQFSALLELQTRGAEFDALHAWMASHLATDLGVEALAARAAMSPRTFQRRYRAATGLTPARAVERLRLEAAQQLLASTALPVKRVAQRCGFGSEETLRRSCQRLLAVSPADFRARFGARRPAGR